MRTNLVLTLAVLAVIAGCGGRAGGSGQAGDAAAGPVTLGMSQSQVNRRLGRGRTARAEPRRHVRRVIYDHARVTFRDGRVIAVSSSRRQPRVLAGVAAGSTERTVRSRLPGVTCRGRASARLCVASVPGSQTTVRLKRGRVTTVRVAESCGTSLVDRRRDANPFPPQRARPAPGAQTADFETGNFSQWDQLDGNLGDRDRYFRLLRRPAPVFDGRYSFQSVVDGKAVGEGEAGQRAMVLVFPSHEPQRSRTSAFEGGEGWYRTHVYFPRDFRPSPDNAWNFVAQWHNWPDGVCCPNVILTVDSSHGCEELSLRAMGGGDAQHPIEQSSVIEERNPAGRISWFVGDPTLMRGHWYDSVVHVKWSYLASRGFVEWWLDGHLIAQQSIPTLYWYADDNTSSGRTPGPGQAYYMEGYYRPAKLPDGRTDDSTVSIIMDGARWGPTRSAVD